MIEKTELEILGERLKAARKNVTKAQKELKLAHEAIAEYECGLEGIKIGINYYVKHDLNGFDLKIGTRMEVVGFYRYKLKSDYYLPHVNCLIDGKVDGIYLNNFLALI